MIEDNKLLETRELRSRKRAYTPQCPSPTGLLLPTTIVGYWESAQKFRSKSGWLDED